MASETTKEAFEINFGRKWRNSKERGWPSFKSHYGI